MFVPIRPKSFAHVKNDDADDNDIDKHISSQNILQHSISRRDQARWSYN
jgi:hypothetical protein